MGRVATKGTIVPLKQQRIKMFIVGESPAMVQRFSEKAVRQMLAKMLKLSSQGRDRREPIVDFIRAAHFMADRQHMGFPANGIKKCMVRGAQITNTMPMTQANTAFFVIPADPVTRLVPLYGTPIFDAAPVRNDGGGCDLRFRPKWEEWASVFDVRFNASVISPEQLSTMCEAGGFGVGLGEYRGEKGGDLGSFRNASPAEVEAIRERHEPGRRVFFEKFEAIIKRVDAEREELWAVLAAEGTELMAALGVDLSEIDPNDPAANKKIAKPRKSKATNGATNVETDVDATAEAEE